MESQGRSKQERKSKLSKAGVTRVETVTTAPNALIPIRPAPSTSIEPTRVNLNLPYIDVAAYNPNDPFGRETITSGPSSGMPKNVLYTQNIKAHLGQQLLQSTHRHPLQIKPPSTSQSTISGPSHSGMPKSLYTMRSVAAINDSGHPSLNAQCGTMQRLQAIPTATGRLQHLPRQPIPKNQTNLNMKQAQNMQALEALPRPPSCQSNLKTNSKMNLPKSQGPQAPSKNPIQETPHVIHVIIQGITYNARNSIMNALRAVFHLYTPRVKSKDLHLLIIVNRLKGLCMGLEHNIFPDFASRFIPRLLEVKNLPFEFEIKDAPRNTPLQENNALHISKNEVHPNSVRMALAFKDPLVTPSHDPFTMNIAFSVGHINVKVAPSQPGDLNLDLDPSIKRDDQCPGEQGLKKKDQKTLGTQTAKILSPPVMSQNLSIFANEHLASLARMNFKQTRFEQSQNEYFSETTKIQKSVCDSVDKISGKLNKMQEFTKQIPIFVEHLSQKRKGSGKVTRVSREAQTDEITLDNLPDCASHRGSGKLSLGDALKTIIKLACKTILDMEKHLFLVAQERDRIIEDNYVLRKAMLRKDVTLKSMTQACRELKYISRSTGGTERRSDRNRSSMSARKLEEDKRLKRKREENQRKDEASRKEDKPPQKELKEKDGRSFEKDSRSFEKDNRSFEKDSRSFEKDSRSFEKDSRSFEKDSRSFEKDVRNLRKNDKPKKFTVDEQIASPTTFLVISDNSAKRDSPEEIKVKRSKVALSEVTDSTKVPKIAIKKERESCERLIPVEKIDQILPQPKPPGYLLSVSNTQPQSGPSNSQISEPPPEVLLQQVAETSQTIPELPQSTRSTLEEARLLQAQLGPLDDDTDAMLSPPRLRPLIIPDESFPAVQTQAFISAVDMILQESSMKVKLIMNEYLPCELQIEGFPEEVAPDKGCGTSLSEFDGARGASGPEDFINRCKAITGNININFKEELEEVQGFQDFIQNPDQYLDGIDLGGLKLEHVEPPMIDQNAPSISGISNPQLKLERFDHDQPPAMDIEIASTMNPVKFEYY